MEMCKELQKGFYTRYAKALLNGASWQARIQGSHCILTRLSGKGQLKSPSR